MTKDPRVEKLRRLKDMQAARREAIDVTVGAMEQLYADKQREIDNIENQLAFERAEKRWPSA